MTENLKTYRLLQEHLDRQPAGFPAVKSGADLKLLARLFTEEEARLACRLSYVPQSLEEVLEEADGEYAREKAEALLESMLKKGAISRREKEGRSCYYLMPLVVGMYEAAGLPLTAGFLKDAGAYMKTLQWGKSFLSIKPSQMRTVPVNKSIRVEHHVASHNDVRSIVQEATGPFVIISCICRAGTKMRRKPCKKTKRNETCLAIGNTAEMILARGHGREISREETLSILSQNEAEGLVFQPSGVKKPEFICSCCGCCCGMLGMQKMLKRPVDFWTSSYQATLDDKKCNSCGRCLSRCQVEALSKGKTGKPKINLHRCIGCGLCITTCAAGALCLTQKNGNQVIPETEDALFEEIRKNRRSKIGEWLTLARAFTGL